MKKDEILNTTKDILCGDRQEAYGDPKDCFFEIAKFWSNYLNAHISTVDVANMMVLLKIARQKTGKGSIDNFIDMAGYAALGGEMFDG